MPPTPRALLGALTGLVGLIAMTRLISGAFSAGMSTFAWFFLLVAMVPWTAYSCYRAWHGRLGRRFGLAVVVLDVAALITVWIAVLGPVLALAFSLAAFALIWRSDWPLPRPQTVERFVRIEELEADDDEDAFVPESREAA